MTKTYAGHRVAVALGLGAALLVTWGRIGHAQPYRANPKGRIIGTWFVEVTLRNCATDAALGSFNSLTTFHEGGTLSESTSSPTFAIGQRGPGHGNWTVEGRRTYSAQIVNLINFYTPPKNLPNTPGFNPTMPIVPEFFPGWATVTFTTELSDTDHGRSVGTTAFYKADGTPYMTGCSTTTSQRFEQGCKVQNREPNKAHSDGDASLMSLTIDICLAQGHLQFTRGGVHATMTDSATRET